MFRFIHKRSPGTRGRFLRVSEEHQKWGGRQNHTELSERDHTERWGVGGDMKKWQEVKEEEM